MLTSKDPNVTIQRQNLKVWHPESILVQIPTRLWFHCVYWNVLQQISSSSIPNLSELGTKKFPVRSGELSKDPAAIQISKPFIKVPFALITFHLPIHRLKAINSSPQTDKSIIIQQRILCLGFFVSISCQRGDAAPILLISPRIPAPAAPAHHHSSHPLPSFLPIHH